MRSSDPCDSHRSPDSPAAVHFRMCNVPDRPKQVPQGSYYRRGPCNFLQAGGTKRWHPRQTNTRVLWNHRAEGEGGYWTVVQEVHTTLLQCIVKYIYSVDSGNYTCFPGNFNSILFCIGVKLNWICFWLEIQLLFSSSSLPIPGLKSKFPGSSTNSRNRPRPGDDEHRYISYCFFFFI